MKKKKDQEKDESRIVEILKAMEVKNLRNDLMWMKGDGVVANDVTVTSSGILSLDVAMGIGGYPHGRIVEIYGPNAAGKTSVTLHAIASFQKKGGVAAFIDNEFSLDTNYAKNLGVDVDNILISQPDCGEKSLEMALALSHELTKGDIIVVDSVAALVPQAEIDGDVGQQHVGLQARLMSQALRKLVGEVSRSGVVLFFTNQIRDNIGVMYGPKESQPGGNALKFFASMRLDIRKKTAIKNGEEILGNATEIKMVKNKLAPPYRIAATEIRYGLGVPRELDLLLLGLECKVIEKNGAYFSYGENNIGQGKEKAWEFLKQCPEIANEIEKEIRKHYGI